MLQNRVNPLVDPSSTGASAGLTLSVVIPALNEEDGIAHIVTSVQETREALQQAGVTDLEVIVVDDGSDDATTQIVEEMESVRLIRHTHNRGYGAAIKTGFEHARGELLAFLDADSTYPPQYLANLCEAIIAGGADIAVGSRRSGNQSSMPLVRRIGNLFWSTLLTLIGNCRVQDPASGMRVLRRDVLDRIYPLPDGLNFTPVMSTRAVHQCLRVAEVPIDYLERSGRSKLSVIRDGTRFLSSIIWTALEYNPARILELLGLSASGMAACIGGSLVLARLQGVTELGPWGVFAVYAALVLAVIGVSVFSLGLTFNYLVALFHREPIQQINLGTRVFGPSLDRHFGWMGLALVVLGASLAAGSLVLGLNGWELPRLWLWLVGSALFVLMGVQLTSLWVLTSILRTLDQRNRATNRETVRRPVALPHTGLDRPAIS
ncbi:MAG TPA: glycosyltransferase [Acidobacteriota bacterium]|nr:glycosyltransferase [Acidobacteriota bacterium]